MKKVTPQIIKNRLNSKLSNFIIEYQMGNMSEGLIYEFFTDILYSANIDSEIIIDVLEDKKFGQLGKDIARDLKVYEGW